MHPCRSVRLLGLVSVLACAGTNGSEQRPLASAPGPSSVLEPSPATASAAAKKATPAQRPRGWQLQPGPAPFVHAAGARLLRFEQPKLVLMEPDGTIVASREVPERFWYGDSAGTRVASGMTFLRDSGRVEALELPTLAPRWKLDLGKFDPFYIDGNTEVVLLRGDDGGTKNRFGAGSSTVMGVDAKTGVALWKRVSKDWTYEAWVAGDAVYLSQASMLEALDARSGSTRWAKKVRAVVELFGHDGRILVHDGESFRALDASNGTEVGAVTTGLRGSGGAVEMADGVVYAKVSSGKLLPALDVGARERVLAIDIRTAKVLWQTPEYAQLDDATGPLSVAGNDVLFCTADGVVRTLDRRTGAPLGAFGLGRCAGLLAREHAGRAWLYANTTSSQVFVSADTPPVQLRVTGTVVTREQTGWDVFVDKPRAGAIVAAFGAQTTTDGDGRFTLDVRGAGQVAVQAIAEDSDPDPKCNKAASARAPALPLDGRTQQLNVKLTLERVCSCGR